MSNIKRFIPIFLIVIFIFLLQFYYKKNISDFEFLKNINFNLILITVILCFLYLITEGSILKNIVKSLNKDISLKEAFLVMNSTYFCNTFVQLSGLGYRVYYLNRYKNLSIFKVINLSIYTIACEILVFSLLGVVSLIIIDFFSENIEINLVIYIVFISLLFSSCVYLFLIEKIFFFFNLNKFLRFKIFKKFTSLLILKLKNKNELLIKQIFLFCLQYLILFIIFLMILYYLKIDNFFYLSLLITSLVDFSFLFALTPYSVGITEFMTIMGTRDTTLSFAEIIVLINLFRLCMLSIYFIFGPIFIIYKTMRKNGM